MSLVNVKGVSFDFGTQTLVIPPIALGDLEQLQDAIAGFKGGIDKASVGTIVDATLAALKRNYPDMTRADIVALLDVGNMLDVFECVMDVSGAKRKAQEAALGEAKGPAAALSTGQDSTQA